MTSSLKVSNSQLQFKQTIVELRAIYDKFGDYGLKEGVMVSGSRVGGGYFMRCAPEAIFDRIFNAVDPWADQANLDGSDFRGSLFGDGYQGLSQKAPAAPQDVVVTLECTLEEFYVGSLKAFSYEVNEVQHDSRSVARQTKHKTVQVDAGFSEATVLTFKGQGHQAPKQEPSNLVIKFKQHAHKQFQRAGDDLIHTCTVSFTDVLNMRPLTLKTLDGRTIT